jgi:hypothetical protein
VIDDRLDTCMAAPRGGDGPRPAHVGAGRPQRAGRKVWAGLIAAGALALLAGPAAAQPRGKPAPAKPAPAPAKPAPADQAEPPGAAPTLGADGKPRVFDFTGLDLAGRLRTPQLLYFLDRASEELERASLERRSFIPAMVRSIDESDL